MGEIRFVGTGETRGYPYLVCKKCIDFTARDKIKKSFSFIKTEISYCYALHYMLIENHCFILTILS